MVTDRYERPHGIQPASLGAALAMSAAMIGGLMLSPPTGFKPVDPVLTGVNIPLDPPPQPKPTPEAKPVVQTRTMPPAKPRAVDTSDPLVPLDQGDAFVPGGKPAGTGDAVIGPVVVPVPTPSPSPVLVDPAIDQRYARDFQPLYPAGEQRAERTGTVTIRVLVGADGRVRQVERVAATSDAFWAATERQALAKWRFRPATRDGIPVEAWRTMTVRFEMG